MEKWSVYTNGKIVNGLSLERVKINLSKIGVGQKSLAAIFSDQQPLEIKKQVSLEEAQKTAKRLTQCGLATKLSLKLNPACFHRSLKKVEQKPETAEWTTELFNPRAVTPSLIGFGGRFSVKNSASTASYSLQNAAYFWQPVPLILASLVGGVVFETYLVGLLSFHLGWGRLATVIGILTLLFCVAILPRLLQPLSFYRIRNLLSHSGVDLQESLVPWLGVRKYQIKNPSGTTTALITRKANTAELEVQTQAKMYFWDKSLTANQIGDKKASALPESFIDRSELGDMLDYFSWLKLFRNLFRKKASPHKNNWDVTNAKIILNEDNAIVALVHQSPTPAIQLRATLASEDRDMLVAFAICLLKSHIA